MKKTKKKKIYGLFFSSLVFFSAPFAFISCGNNNKGEIISVVTNNNQLNDESINQQIYLGADQFQKNSKDKNGIPKYFVKFDSPSKVDKKYNANSFAAYNKSYQDSISVGAKTLVLSGTEQESIGKISNFAEQHSNKNFLLIGKSEKLNLKNMRSIDFNYVQSGMEAAFYAGVYFNLNAEISTNEIKIATFGRALSYDAVEYMDGFQQGVKIFNDLIAKQTLPFTKTLSLFYAKNNKPSKLDFIQNLASSKKETQDLKTLITNYLTQDKVQVFFPVNQVQAKQTLKFINSQPNDPAWLIGNNFNFKDDDPLNQVIGAPMINFKGAVLSSLNNLYRVNKKPWKNENISFQNKEYYSFVSGPNNTDKSKKVLSSQEWMNFLKSSLFLNAKLAQGNDTFGSLFKNDNEF